MSRATILLIDDEVLMEKLMRSVLEKEGFHVRISGSISDAISDMEKAIPDLILLDRMLPDGDGIDICNYVRNNLRLRHIPILFLSQKQRVTERITSLKVGGDDYLPKPFDISELVARIEALLRRSKSNEVQEQSIHIGNLSLDIQTHECHCGERLIRLRPKEFELLKLFMESKNRVLTKEFLSERIWDTPHLASSRAIDTAVQRLRRKLGSEESCIETVRGYGFRFNESPFLEKNCNQGKGQVVKND